MVHQKYVTKKENLILVSILKPYESISLSTIVTPRNFVNVNYNQTEINAEELRNQMEEVKAKCTLWKIVHKTLLSDLRFQI